MQELLELVCAARVEQVNVHNQKEYAHRNCHKVQKLKPICPSNNG
jgi:hypothetical protein